MEAFQNKVVIVTGGGDGIGKALVELLLNAGAKVVTCGRRLEKFSYLEKHYHDQPCHVEKADVRSEEDCRRLIDITIQKFGRLDILINNAGISMRAEVLETQTETLRQVMDINFWGAVYCTKYALPYLLESKGVILGISSIAGYRGLPGRSGYSASKFALQGWLESLRTELLHKGVHVMWVSPGFTASSIRQHALNASASPQGESPLDEKSLMSAPECALRILQAIVEKKRTVVMTLDGKKTVWLNKFWPGLADRLVYRFFYKNGELIK